MRRRATKGPRLLTEVELELMTILWRLGSGTVAEVRADLPSTRNLAYTSVSTVLRILEKKGLVRSRKEGRGRVYLPAIEQERYQARALGHVIDHLFGGAPASLVRRLIESEKLTDEEVEEIRAVVRKAGKS